MRNDYISENKEMLLNYFFLSSMSFYITQLKNQDLSWNNE